MNPTSCSSFVFISTLPSFGEMHQWQKHWHWRSNIAVALNITIIALGLHGHIVSNPIPWGGIGIHPSLCSDRMPMLLTLRVAAGVPLVIAMVNVASVCDFVVRRKGGYPCWFAHEYFIDTC